jgi:phytanoyl-CoA hydroxylase
MSSGLKQQYDEHGYAIVRGAIDAGLAAETAGHVHWLARENPGVRPEKFFHNFLIDDPFMHRLVSDERILDLIEPFIGPDIALYAPHYIAKPPGDGKPVLWHQDGYYWPLEPMEVITVWLAGTASTRANGCMRVLPGTQNMRLLSRREMVDVDEEQFVLNSQVHPSLIDDSDVVDLELDAGDLSIHNPRIIHGSEGNTSDSWRIGLTLRYIPTSTRVKSDGWRNILVRGQPDPHNGNLYAERPRYVPGVTMAFRGAEAWQGN